MLTPLDVQQQRFSTSLKGYNQREVEGYLELVSNELEHLLQEMQSVKDDLRRRESELLEFQEREKLLKETMTAAQKMAADMRANAQKESEVIIGQAQVQAEKIVSVAYQRLANLIDDINELKRQRAKLVTTLRTTLDSHRQMLEVTEQDELADSTVEERLKFLKNKKELGSA